MSRAALAIFVCAVAPLLSMQNKQIINVGPPPIGPYSGAVKAGGFIYLSGTLAQDDK